MTLTVSGRIAGYRPRPQADGLTVDYADVLRQAVDNERWRTMREVLRAVDAVSATESSSGYDYQRKDRGGQAVKRDILAALARLESTCDPA